MRTRVWHSQPCGGSEDSKTDGCLTDSKGGNSSLTADTQFLRSRGSQGRGSTTTNQWVREMRQGSWVCLEYGW
jgi:hypothetical protein